MSSFLGRAFGLRSAEEVRDPMSDRWYPEGATPSFKWSSTGDLVTPEIAMRVSTVFACVRVMATMVGSLPLPIYRRRPDGGREEAPGHPLYQVLHDQPNKQQTSYDWRAMEQAHLMLRGNGYNLLVPGRRGFADQILPMHPDRIKPEYNAGDGRWVPAEIAEISANGRMRYLRLRGLDGQSSPTYLAEEDVFHVKGPFSVNGLVGVSVLAYMADAVGLARASESYGARFFKDGVGGKVFITHPGELDDEGHNRLQAELQKTLGGQANMHRVGLLEEGMKAERLGLTAEDAQFLESRAFQVEDLLRFLGIPGVLVGHPDKTATFASAEAFFASFITHTLGPWLTNWEQAIFKDLILEETHYVDFVEDALLKGDSAARAAFYRVMVELGIFTRNEVRTAENKNPLAGLDEPLTPKNMSGGPADPLAGDPPPAPAPKPPKPADEEEDDEARKKARRRRKRRQGRLQQIVAESAARLVRREQAHIRKWAPRFASDPKGWDGWLQTFYGKQKEVVREALCLEEHVAAAYAAAQRDELLAQGVGVIETWSETRAAQLARLAAEGA